MPRGVKRKPLRLGSIQYLNSLPIDMGILKGHISLEAEMVRGVPAFLNREINADLLDVSPVSAMWYAQHAADLVLLPDLTISSESGVQSVLLFSRKPIAELKERQIFMTSQGRTTPVLFKILCKKFYGFEPNLREVSEPGETFPEEADALLLIGDDALEYREKWKGMTGITVIDLAGQWRRWTGLPFVFALWAVRRAYLKTRRTAVKEVWEALHASKEWAYDHPDAVMREARKTSGLSERVLREYYSCLSYDWSEELEKGMRHYFDLAVECGYLDAAPKIEWAFPLSPSATETA